LLASLLTDVEGCAHCFDRGFVTYTDQAKVDQLGVASDLLTSKGAVSSEVAEAMASGALARSAADLTVAITGFAGAGGPGEEAGLVYISVARRDSGMRTREHHFGDVGRGEVRIRCLRSALEMLLAGLADSCS
jgi:nicotinamide-nucleotide amidase